MSTDPQLLGDSRRRQLEASRAYAAAHGLELAEGAELEDIGVSAFKGANISEGALGRPGPTCSWNPWTGLAANKFCPLSPSS
jgi:hypothetical protein